MNIRITTPRLLLREYKRSDWRRVHEYAQNEQAVQYESWGPNSAEETRRFVKVIMENGRLEPRYIVELAIILQKERKLIGGCGLRIDTENTRKGDFGYIINPAYWNKGYATEAATALINYAAENLGIMELEATCDVMNKASQRVLEKCGLKRVKLIENHFEMKGRIRDSYLYEIILAAPTPA